MFASSVQSRPGASTALQRTERELEPVGKALQSETFEESLIEAVKAAGGSKAVALALWPAAAARDLDAARRKLTNSLDPERAEKLSLDEVLHVMRMARDVGCHTPMAFLCASLGYAAPVPVQPHDEADDLRRQVLAMGQQLQRALARIEQIERPSAQLRAA